MDGIFEDLNKYHNATMNIFIKAIFYIGVILGILIVPASIIAVMSELLYRYPLAAYFIIAIGLYTIIVCLNIGRIIKYDEKKKFYLDSRQLIVEAHKRGTMSDEQVLQAMTKIDKSEKESSWPLEPLKGEYNE
jgi:hypothetical protein